MTKKYISVVFQYEDGANLPSNLVTAFSSFSKEYEDCIVYDTYEGNVIDDLKNADEEINSLEYDLHAIGQEMSDE